MDFYLTQRLERRTYKREGDKGLDVNFQLDYMGSSEFEWGAIPAALKEMRATSKLVLNESTVNMGGIERKVYFVSDAQSYQALREKWGSWVDGGMRGKESTHFAQAFRGDLPEIYRTEAWWSIDSNFAWTLDPELAPLLLSGLAGEPAPLSKRQARKQERVNKETDK